MPKINLDKKPIVQRQALALWYAPTKGWLDLSRMAHTKFLPRWRQGGAIVGLLDFLGTSHEWANES